MQDSLSSTGAAALGRSPKSPRAPPPPARRGVCHGLGFGGGGADLSLALAAPPRVSRLTVSKRVFPESPTSHNFPFLLTTDSSGLLLLSAILAAPRTHVDINRPGLQSISWRDSNPRYFVLDATTGSAFRLPDPSPEESIMHQALVGVVASPSGGGRYMVAELVPFFGSKTADLRCFSSDIGEWVIKRVHYPLPPRIVSPLCTLAPHGRLWWADYSWGIITADPFTDDPVLGFIPLPRPCVLDLRFVDTYRRGGAPNKVTVWTLPNPDATEWTLEHEATFVDIWADDTYKATGLAKKVPVLALIHPHNPAVVYFFLEDHLFGVDVRARKVVECDRYHLVAPPRAYPIANRFIRAWEPPRAVSSGLPPPCLLIFATILHSVPPPTQTGERGQWEDDEQETRKGMRTELRRQAGRCRWIHSLTVAAYQSGDIGFADSSTVTAAAELRTRVQ
ncbi:hypothetical protein PVAP13_6NG265500 [Panicum virgatum]|uniref:DUF1618 domain-containing protein n=1 Tax=Panicum virgatum TaxID=38727 RepID=A0A8T0R353_PANVG|nr:hypothetical protein PVAP13_6NG265500 [Panicum virgatum]